MYVEEDQNETSFLVWNWYQTPKEENQLGTHI